MTTTRALSEFVAGTRYGDLPASLVERLKLYTIDALAVGFVAGDLPWVQIVRSVTARQGGAPEASAFGVAHRMPAAGAALVNGMAIGGAELDHGAFLAHPASTVFPAVLAAAETVHASGADFLCAMALGYEVACRVGTAQTRSTEDERGFHNPGVNGPFGSAAGAGKALGLDAASLASALGIAGSYAGGTVEYLADGSMTKRLHLGLAAEAGMRAARLAQAGFTGPATILEGDHGVLRAFSPAPDVAALGRDLGTDWLSARMRIKRYPCHGALQAAVAAMQELRRNHCLTTESVEGIRIVANRDDRLLQDRFQQARPQTLIEAQCSAPFALAVAAVRDLTTPSAFDHRVLDDPDIARLAERVRSERSDAATTIIVDTGGSTLSAPAEDDAVHPHDTRAAADERFHRFSEDFAPADMRESVVEMVWSLESLSDVAALASIIGQYPAQPVVDTGRGG